MQIDLGGKLALVTGSTGQLGRTIALTLAECGADVVLHYLKNEEKAAELAQKVASMGRRAIPVQADITDKESVDLMAALVKGQYKAPEIVIDCAVSQYKWLPVLEQDISCYEEQFRSCVMQNVLMAKAFIPDMIKAAYGRFIGINTECAMQCLPTQSAYVSGKRGMDGVLRVLAREVGEHGITVNQVAPGWTISDNDRANGTQRDPAYEAHTALKRRGTDQEIANAVAFLASDLASFITGVYLPVCGGYVMPGI
ncbi:MAG: SDR family NAD(P)-dependent oxidoreductase [Christensenellales bacterium]